MYNPKSPIQFASVTTDHHKCYGEKEGDWVVFRCPICLDYERRFNSKTGEVKNKFDIENAAVQHYGTFVPPGLDTGLYVAN